MRLTLEGYEVSIVYGEYYFLTVIFSGVSFLLDQLLYPRSCFCLVETTSAWKAGVFAKLYSLHSILEIGQYRAWTTGSVNPGSMVF